MPQSRRSPVTDPLIDDYPVRPPDIVEKEEINSQKKQKQETRTLVLLSLTYFLYGLGISIYGPLYPEHARKAGLNPLIYGAVLATSHFTCILMYPIACRIVTSVPCRNSLSVSVFVIGACRALFGTIYLMPETTPSITVAFAVQVVEGIGMSILVASTIITVCGGAADQIQKISLAIESSMNLGLVLGPIIGEVIKEVLGFDFPFYIIGGLTALHFIFTVTLLPEPDQQISYVDVPIVFWMSNGRMIVYFFVLFATFNYVGFLSVSLELLLQQFKLSALYTGLVFSISPFVYALTFPGWSWIINKWFNSALLIFIGNIIILGSLILLGPAPYISLKGSLLYVCWALVLEGLGVACKAACVLDASEIDLRHQRRHTEIQQQLIIHTVFILSSSFGYFFGSLTAGITNNYIGYRKGTLPLFGLEICVAVLTVIFAFNRNYVARKYMKNAAERQPILRS